MFCVSRSHNKYLPDPFPSLRLRPQCPRRPACPYSDQRVQCQVLPLSLSLRVCAMCLFLSVAIFSCCERTCKTCPLWTRVLILHWVHCHSIAFFFSMAVLSQEWLQLLSSVCAAWFYCPGQAFGDSWRASPSGCRCPWTWNICHRRCCPELRFAAKFCTSGWHTLDDVETHLMMLKQTIAVCGLSRSLPGLSRSWITWWLRSQRSWRWCKDLLTSSIYIYFCCIYHPVWFPFVSSLLLFFSLSLLLSFSLSLCLSVSLSLCLSVSLSLCLSVSLSLSLSFFLSLSPFLWLDGRPGWPDFCNIAKFKLNRSSRTFWNGVWNLFRCLTEANEFYFEGHSKSQAPWRFHEDDGNREYKLKVRTSKAQK